MAKEVKVNLDVLDNAKKVYDESNIGVQGVQTR